MKDTIHIIADIAGHFDSFLELIKKLPPGRIILLGDLIDRGPKSREVIQYCIDNNITSLIGNHEHIFLDYYNGIEIESYNKFYKDGVWIAEEGQNFNNGGMATAKSYMNGTIFEKMNYHHSMIGKIIPKEHIDFIKKMPFYLLIDDLILSHAPIFGKHYTLDKLSELGSPTKEGMSTQDWNKLNNSLIWNRGNPHLIKGKIQIFGHQGAENVKYYTNQFKKGTYKPQKDFWAICLDASKGNKLTALSYPSMEITQQDYID